MGFKTIMFARLPCNKGFAFDFKLREIGFIEDMEYRKTSILADKEAEEKGLGCWQRTIGYTKNDKKIIATINVVNKDGWVQPTFMELFELHNFTMEEAEEILAILKLIHPEIGGEIMGFLK